MVERTELPPAGRRVLIVQQGDPLNGRKGRVVRYPDAWSALVLPFPLRSDPEPTPVVVMRGALQPA
jgi:hypothetical protein